MFCFSLYLRAISKYKPPRGGAYICRGNLTEGFLRYEFGGLIHGGAYFRNFTVDNNRAKVCFMSVRCNLVDCLSFLMSLSVARHGKAILL